MVSDKCVFSKYEYKVFVLINCMFDLHFSGMMFSIGSNMIHIYSFYQLIR